MAAVPDPTLQRLGPVAQLRAGRLTRRTTQLLVGLAIYGLSMAIVLRANLGSLPWDVLHQGLARRLPLDFGEIVIAVSLVVLLLWIPIREVPGLGTISNALLVGLAANLGLAVLGTPPLLAERIGLMAAGIVLNGLATALYIGAQFGAGPRDGLMTGLHRRTGLSVRAVRTSLEVTVVVVGWLLGGVLGVGTLLYALAIGPLVQALLPSCVVGLSPPARP